MYVFNVIWRMQLEIQIKELRNSQIFKMKPNFLVDFYATFQRIQNINVCEADCFENLIQRMVESSFCYWALTLNYFGNQNSISNQIDMLICMNCCPWFFAQFWNSFDAWWIFNWNSLIVSMKQSMFLNFIYWKSEMITLTT